MALVDQDPSARVDDLVTLNEQGIVLRFSVRIELETREPGRSVEMIYQLRTRNFQVTESVNFRQNRPDIVADDAAVIRLGQVGGSGRGAGGDGRRPIL